MVGASERPRFLLGGADLGEEKGDKIAGRCQGRKNFGERFLCSGKLWANDRLKDAEAAGASGLGATAGPLAVPPN